MSVIHKVDGAFLGRDGVSKNTFLYNYCQDISTFLSWNSFQQTSTWIHFKDSGVAKQPNEKGHQLDGTQIRVTKKIMNAC